MDPNRYLEAIHTHGSRLADGAEAAGLDAVVPSCPGWTVTDLVGHVDTVCQFWAAIASGALADPADFVPRPDGPPAGVVDGFRAEVDSLVGVLAPLDPAQPCWTWTDDHTVGFVQRRLAHELAVHGWDATAARGQAIPIEADLAVDGVDEYLDVFVPTNAAHADGVALSGHLHATDADGEWLVATGDGAWRVERAHAKGDVAIRGTASDLVALLWGRRSIDGGQFEVFGDADSLGGFLTRLSLG